MARKNPKAEANAPAATRETTMTEITVQGVNLPVEARFAEGHTLTAIEASVLNQTLFENLRNNFAPKVKLAKETLGDAFDVNTPYTVGDGDEAVTHPAIAEAWTAHVEAYQFGVRRVGGGTGKRVGDPYEREALRLAKASVESAIKTKYGKLSAVPKETIAALIETHSKSEAIMAKARENVDSIAGIDLGLEF